MAGPRAAARGPALALCPGRAPRYNTRGGDNPTANQPGSRAPASRRPRPPRQQADERMKIVHYPHPALRRPGRQVGTVDKKLRVQVGEMMEAMYEARGLGLAAPQVALPFQLLVMNITGDPNQRDREEVFINPVIVERKGSMDDEEGCLSFPGLYQKVRRAKTIKVQAYNLK